MRRAVVRVLAATLLAVLALFAFRLRRADRDEGPRLAELLPPSALAAVQVPSVRFLEDRLAPSPLGAWATAPRAAPAFRRDPRAAPPGPWPLAQRLLASARQSGGEAFVACTGISISPRLDLDLLAGFDAGTPAAAAAIVEAWGHRCRLEFPELRVVETEIASTPCESWRVEGEPPLLVANYSRWVLASRGERPLCEAILHARARTRAKGPPPLTRASHGDARAVVNPPALGEQLKPLAALQPSLRGQLDQLLPFGFLAASLRVRQGVSEESWRWWNLPGPGNPSALFPCRRAALRFAGPGTAAGLVAALDWVAALPVEGMADPLSPEVSGPLAGKLKDALPLAVLARLAPHLGPECGLFVEHDADGAPSLLVVVQSRNETALRERLRGAGATPLPGQPALAILGKPPSTWTFGFSDGWFLLSDSPAVVARAIAMGMASGGLDAKPDFRAAMARLPADAASIGFVDGAFVANLLSRAAQTGPGVDSQVPAALRDRILGLDAPRLAEPLKRAGWTTFAVRIDASGGEFRLRGPVTPLGLAALLALRAQR